MISDSISLALRNIRRRKLRSWLTIIGIVISIATIFILVSLSLGLQGAVEEQFRQLGTDKFFIQPRGQLAGPGTGGAVELTLEDVEVIEKTRGVNDITYAAVGNAKVEYSDQTRYVFALGVPLEKTDVFLETGFYNLDEGRFLDKGDSGEIVIGSQYKYNQFFRRPVQIGDKLDINGQEFKVIGILHSIGNPPDDRAIYLSYEDFKSLFNITNRVDQIIVKTDSQTDINEVADRVRRDLLKSRDLEEETRDFTILTPEELLRSFGTILNIITAFLFGVAAISLLVGSVGIANTMFTSVLERTKEIGTMKAVGAQNSDILTIFLVESGILGLIGGVVGVIFGILAGILIEYIAVNQLGTNLLQISTPAWLVVSSLTFSFFIGAASGAIPAYRAARIRPVDALRYE